MRARDISSIMATWLGLTAAIGGGYATHMQYRDSVAKQGDDRATAAINFVLQFQNLQMLPIRDKVYEAIFCSSDCATKSVSQSELFAFVEFFDSVKYCADRGICDVAIVRETFGSYATWHWPCLKGTIEAVRRGEAKFNLSRPYGHGLETLAIMDVGQGHCGNLRARR